MKIFNYIFIVLIKIYKFTLSPFFIIHVNLNLLVALTV